jgi:hypothetical protein
VQTRRVKRLIVWGLRITIVWYAGSLLLMAAGTTNPQIGVIGVFGWLVAVGFALLNAILSGVAVAWHGRASVAVAAGAAAASAFGIGLSLLLLSSIPSS